MITGPFPGPFPGPSLILIPDSQFYCPYPVLWALLLVCVALGITIGYRRAETWKRIHTLLHNWIFRLLTA